MKMENEILSPSFATVKKILVKKGEKVKKGQLLIILE
jgi:biotin carboxyl carrier protein